MSFEGYLDGVVPPILHGHQYRRPLEVKQVSHCSRQLEYVAELVQPLAVLDEEAVLWRRGGVGMAGCARLHELLKTGPNMSIVRNLEKEEERIK